MLLLPMARSPISSRRFLFTTLTAAPVSIMNQSGPASLTRPITITCSFSKLNGMARAWLPSAKRRSGAPSWGRVNARPAGLRLGRTSSSTIALSSPSWIENGTLSPPTRRQSAKESSTVACLTCLTAFRGSPLAASR
jgi:hypothetical protein